MKTLAIGVCALVTFAAVGCNESTPERSTATASTENPAQPVTTVKKPVVENPIAGDADKKPVIEKPIAGEADKTFSLACRLNLLPLRRERRNLC